MWSLHRRTGQHYADNFADTLENDLQIVFNF